MRRKTTPLLAAALAAACAPRPYDFPVGLYAVSKPEDAARVAHLGFNAVQCYDGEDIAQARAMQKAARAADEMLLIAPDAPMKAGASAKDFPGAVWYLQDEPDVSGVSPETLAARDKKVAAWAPGAARAFVVGDADRAKDYPGIGQVLMEDWYPVPHLPLESSGDKVAAAVKAAGGRRVWAVLQAFDWRLSPQHDPNKPRVGRFPTFEEMRFLSYDAVLNGARGLWYFALEPAPDYNLLREPWLMVRLARVSLEMSQMAPIFARGAPEKPPYPPSDDAPVVRAWRYRGRDYAVLTVRRPGKYKKVPEVMLSGRWRALFAPRRDPRDSLLEHEGGWYLGPYEVLVLESRPWPF